MLKEISTARLDDIQGGLFVDASAGIGYGTLFAYPSGGLSINFGGCGTPAPSAPSCPAPAAPAPSCGSSLTTIAIQYFLANYNPCQPAPKPAPCAPAPKPTSCTPAPRPTCGGTTPAPSVPL